MQVLIDLGLKHATKICDWYIGKKKFDSKDEFFNYVYSINDFYEELRHKELTKQEWDILVQRYLKKEKIRMEKWSQWKDTEANKKLLKWFKKQASFRERKIDSTDHEIGIGYQCFFFFGRTMITCIFWEKESRHWQKGFGWQVHSPDWDDSGMMGLDGEHLLWWLENVLKDGVNHFERREKIEHDYIQWEKKEK